MCCYQHCGFGEFLSSGSRAQSSHFPDPLFLPCAAHEKTKGQWATQFWNHCYNERKTQLHTSLGVTGNTLRSGNAQSHSHNQVSSHCHHWQQKRDSPNVTSNSWLIHRGIVWLLPSQLIYFALTVLLAYRDTPAERVLFVSYKKLKYSMIGRTCAKKFKHPVFGLHNTC